LAKYAPHSIFRRVGGLSRDSTHVPTPNSHRIVSTTFGDDHLGSIGGKLGDFRFRLRSLTVTKTAQALKLRHPTNRTNLMAVLLPYRSPSLTHGCDGSSRNQEECTLYTAPHDSELAASESFELGGWRPTLKTHGRFRQCSKRH
jgi:hypothetical protein